MIDTVLSGELRDSDKILARKIWNSAVVLAESVEAEEVSGGAVVICSEADVGIVRDGGVVVYDTGEVNTKPSGNSVQGIQENEDCVVRAIRSTGQWNEAYDRFVKRFDV